MTLTQQTKKIKWFYHDMQVEAIILYTSKDYRFKLISPFTQEFDGGHMPYMIRIAYTLLEGDDQDIKKIEKNGILYWNLRPIIIERCNEFIYSSLADDGK